MWWYLESDFSTKDALANPYGPGRRSRDADEREMPIKCPQFEYLSEEQALEENVDTDEEYDFGELKRKERVAILATDMAPVVTGPKRTSKKGEFEYKFVHEHSAIGPPCKCGEPACLEHQRKQAMETTLALSKVFQRTTPGQGQSSDPRSPITYRTLNRNTSDRGSISTLSSSA